MARPEKPLLDGKGELAALAKHLRDGRGGMTYKDLASRSGDYSPTTLQRAASGERLPRREVARAYAHACGLDIDHVDRLWEAAYREKKRSARGEPLPTGLPPHLVHSLADLSAALVALHATHGGPTIRLMHKRARQRPAECTPLSTSTLHRILRRTAVPTSRDGLHAFLIGCEVPLPQRYLWEQAAARARRNHRADTAQAHQAMAQLEAQFAEDAAPRLTPDRATQLLRAAGLHPAEAYRGFTVPWTVRCLACDGVQRIRLSDVAQRQRRCPVCPSRNPAQASGEQTDTS
ncbi:helix-turn-helix transcriptional regulator [Streptomyces sp. NPDC051773]|uniref:helix-turn-helix domain-containing protein n=1 Tax=Streptomyces sp. NPDC051773 TaxID=3156682 RepID=UPI0034138A02